jgi:hypothetical protein
MVAYGFGIYLTLTRKESIHWMFPGTGVFKVLKEFVQEMVLHM